MWLNLTKISSESKHFRLASLYSQIIFVDRQTHGRRTDRHSSYLKQIQLIYDLNHPIISDNYDSGTVLARVRGGLKNVTISNCPNVGRGLASSFEFIQKSLHYPRGEECTRIFSHILGESIDTEGKLRIRVLVSRLKVPRLSVLSQCHPTFWNLSHVR